MAKWRYVYKLLRPDLTSYGGCQWGPGVEHTAPGNGKLCTDAYLHAYSHPLLAVFYNPIHGAYGEDAVLWKCKAIVEKIDGTKLGCTWIKSLYPVQKPTLTTNQRIWAGIQIALWIGKKNKWEGYEKFKKWANSWLANMDRTASAAWAASAAEAAAGASAGAASAAEAAARASAGKKTLYFLKKSLIEEIT